MPWLKAGDNAATYPAVLRSATGGDARQVNEVFGFVARCALQSAAHMTDYFIDEGVAWMMGGPETDRLTKAAVKCGLFKRERKDGHRGWMLVDDPDFLHIMLRAEVEWEKQQKADTSNPALIVPVRQRDGDGCRYCGVIVQWRARKGARRGTYDHRVPKQPATVDTLVVACGGCNTGRRDDPEADQKYPLRDAPTDPYYGDQTVSLLAAHGITVTPSSTPARPASQADTVNSSDPTTGTPRQRPCTQQDTAPATPAGGHRADLQIQPDRLPTTSGSTGTGRERDGPGRVAQDAQLSGHSHARTRQRRSRRGRPRTAGDR